MPTSRDQPAKSGQPRTQVHACERQGRGEDRGNISLTKGSSCEDILMALLALNSIPSLSDPCIIVKAIDELQDFMSKVYNENLK